MTNRSARIATQRRDRTHARRRVLDAALALVEDRRWPDVSVEDVMATAGFSRTVFYRHFDDRDDLLLALLGELAERLESTGLAWKTGAGDPLETLHAGLAELTGLMADHGRLVQAVVDASAYDLQVRAAHSGLVEAIIAVAAERIRAEVAAGRSGVRDPDDVAAALVRMSEFHLLAGFGHRPLADQSRATATLTEVWAATIYGRPERAPAAQQGEIRDGPPQ